MNAGRPAQPGRTRVCPHCKATILESASVCPGCQHHLRFDPAAVQRPIESQTAMRVEGTISPPAVGEPCEFTVVIVMRDERGAEIGRQVVSVGALRPDERRSFALSVEVSPLSGPRPISRG
jgi:RNA polymerase subunit RPABC4/transcription elongation factor Spt4